MHGGSRDRQTCGKPSVCYGSKADARQKLPPIAALRSRTTCRPLLAGARRSGTIRIRSGVEHMHPWRTPAMILALVAVAGCDPAPDAPANRSEPDTAATNEEQAM